MHGSAVERARRNRGRRLLAALATLAAVTLTFGAAGAAAHADRTGDAGRGRDRLEHVFVIVLENYKAEDVTPVAAPFLSWITRAGVSLDQMYGVDHASLSNYIAMTSGNTPNAKTRADCFLYDCILESPQDTNIGDQLEAHGLDWKAYLESMPAPCSHPTVSGRLDPYLVGYATRHNPFVYYRDIVGPDLTVVPPRCVRHDVPFTRFANDLAHHHVPNYSFIVPDTCNDAHDRGTSCALPAADSWLIRNVPAILASPEYRHRGALVITFDESESTDTRGCCGNAVGGRIFTSVLSPFVTHPGAHSSVPYSHYSVLRSIEDAFGLGCLGHACDSATTPFGTDVWSLGGRHHERHDGHDGHGEHEDHRRHESPPGRGSGRD